MSDAAGPDAARIPLALYVHMPWCVRKCPYCDFNSHQLRSSTPDPSYIDALIRDFEGELRRFRGRRIDSVFFGGGTPSLFRPEEYRRLLDALRERAEIAADAEITLEANPGTIEHGSFAGYRHAGINRVSLGAQTFSAGALAALGRIHSADDTYRAVEELRAAGLDNFNVDLMYALPDQSLEQASEDVRRACALGPAHISYYQLTLEPGTVFHARPPQLPDEETSWAIQCAGQRMLADAGYVQYEVSAYARAGARCRHNLNYWLFGDYVGIGAGAHGKVSSSLPGRVMRTVKPKQPREYLAQVALPPAADGAAPVPVADLPFEFMLNALRLTEGFDLADYRQRTGLGWDSIEAGIRAAEARGLLTGAAGRWKPTDLGLRFLNDLQGGFLA
ncbi:MAG TPA: radical SAM family heme chaperone HemW [Steroidobacteraceae bacterium]|nr:radical SAM family heme chaperone HemW [Steroidobacteraceae bacterium]